MAAILSRPQCVKTISNEISIKIQQYSYKKVSKINNSYLFHAGFNNTRNATKTSRRNTWHVESNYILQPPKYLIIIGNRFRYINHNVTKHRYSTRMDMTIVLGLHKFSLQATIDHHAPSMYSGHKGTNGYEGT